MSGSFESLRDIEVDKALHAKICVIGSGPGGGIVAASLAQKGHDVLVLEAGSRDTAMPDDGVGTTRQTGLSRLQFSRAFQYGGSSNLWAGKVLPMEPVDFEKRPWIPESGWPVSHQSLRPYYDAGYDLLDLKAPQWSSPDSLTQLGKALRAGHLDIKSFIEHPTRRFRVADHLDTVIADNPGCLRILTDAPVMKLIANEDGRVTAASVQTPDGHTRNVTADIFILGAGGLEVPRLLLLSNDHQTSGLGNQHDLIGRYLGTHPRGDVGTLTLNHWSRTNNCLFSTEMHDGVLLRVGLGLSPEMQRQHELTNTFVELWPSLAHHAGRLFESAKDAADGFSGIIDRNAFARKIMVGGGLFAFRAIAKLGRAQPLARTFAMRVYSEDKPNPNNRVRLSNQHDSLGRQKIDIDYTFSDFDQQALIRFLKRLDTEIREHDIGHIDPKAWHDFDREKLTTIQSHLLGATRMGENPRTGVVDTHCRVFDCSNLYVSSPSVFPTYGFANPFLTIVALAYRLADHLDSELS